MQARGSVESETETEDKNMLYPMSAIESYDIVGGGSTQTNVETAGEQPSKRIKCIHLISSTLMKRQMDMLNGSLVYKW